MPTLDELGFTKNCMVETILTTYSPGRSPHACALGVQRLEKGKLSFKLFTDSQTFQNVSSTRAGTINVVEDAEKIAKSGLPEIFPREEAFKFESSEVVEAPRLAEASAFVEFKVEGLTIETISDELGTSEVAEIIASVENIKYIDSPPRPFKRSESFLIESAIRATRAIEIMNRDKKNIAEKMTQEIAQYDDKCQEIASDSPECKLISKILNYLEGKG